MADLSNVQFDPQNPDALFSQDQWSNQFSNFNNKAIPWPSSYVGWPTDAMGNPIGGGPSQQAQAPSASPAQSAPGTTINSTPAGASGTFDYSKMGSAGAPLQELMNNYQAAQAKLSPQQLYNQAQTKAMNANAILFNNQGYQGPGTTFGAVNRPLQQQMQGYAMGMGQPQQATPQQAPPSAPAAPGGLTYPQVLAMLANPGKVTTPGATVPASATSAQPAGGVNNAFLGQAQGKPGMNQNFLSTLAALQGRGRG
jgi:hypothetical protein